MKNNIENGIYIPDDTRRLFTLDDWMTREHPETAQTVVLVTDFGMLEIAKKNAPVGCYFEGAQEAAAKYGQAFRCPTRHEAIEIYNARARGLDEAFKKIGGQPAMGIFWTSECDPELRYSSALAFVFDLDAGSVAPQARCRIYSVRPVCDFKSRQ